MQEVKNAAVPYNNVGLLELKWVPQAGPNDGDETKDIQDVEDEAQLLGKPWTYRLELKRATNLPICCELAYVSYDFFGETFLTGTLVRKHLYQLICREYAVDLAARCSCCVLNSMPYITRILSKRYINSNHHTTTITEAVEDVTYSPVFDYAKVHHIPSVTPEFIAYLKGSIEMHIYVNQKVETPVVSCRCCC